MERLSKNYQDFIYLLACGLNSRKADASRASQMDFKALLKIAKHQNLVNVAYEPIKEFCNIPEWNEAYEQGIRRSMLFDEERKHICEFLDSQKIWYALLKGAVLQELYPVFGMRQMVDVDVFVDKTKLGKIENFMKQRGYKLSRTTKHDAYTKKPVYCFEIHNQICISHGTQKVNNYFAQIDNRLVNHDNSFMKSFTLQDFYLHIVQHFNNHLKCSYGGLKFLCDIYVLLKFPFKQEDFNKFEDIAKKLEIQNDELKFRHLALKLFYDDKMPVLKDEEFQILESCMNNGERGNFQIYVKNKLKRDLKNPKNLVRDVYLALKTWGPKKILKGFKII